MDWNEIKRRLTQTQTTQFQSEQIRLIYKKPGWKKNFFVFVRITPTKIEKIRVFADTSLTETQIEEFLREFLRYTWKKAKNGSDYLSLAPHLICFKDTVIENEPVVATRTGKDK